MTDNQMDDDFLRAEYLIEALPYIQEYRGSTVVIKFGGHAMVTEELKSYFARDITLLQSVGIKPVVVHGGGPDINKFLDKLNIETKFVNGLRYTDGKTMEVVEMVLAGKIGKDLSNYVSKAGGSAVSLSGKDSRLIMAQKISDTPSKGNPGEDLGLVGIPVGVNVRLINKLADAGYIPIIAPVGADGDGVTYNINADSAAAAIAVSMKARKLILLTDVAGVLDENKELVMVLTAEKLEELNAKNIINGGMTPKIECCLKALNGGCDAAAIIDGRKPHSLLLEIFTHKGCGTEVKIKGAREGEESSAISKEEETKEDIKVKAASFQ